MSWKEGVQSRFSPREDADKWDRMYAQDTENLDDEFFRLRRDFTVAYVTSRYDASATICDLGCGAGPVISALLNRGYDAIGFDYSIDMLDNAARRIATGTAGRRPLARCDIQALPLGDDSFDCAVCLGVISYVEHYENIIREIRRILKPGGTAIVSYRNENNLMVSDPVGPVKYLGRKTLESVGHAPREFRIGNHMSHGEVGRTLQRNGLTLEAFKGIGLGPLRFNRRPL
jgi:SAM-dependent methyltransferase